MLATRCPKCGGEREIIAVILRDDVIVRILDQVGLPSQLPALKPARGPPDSETAEQATRSQLPLHFEEDCFADPDYSEFDCIDEEPPEADGTQPTQVGEDSRLPTDLLELVNHYPGKQLCCTKVPLRGASDLAEDDGDKAE